MLIIEQLSFNLNFQVCGEGQFVSYSDVVFFDGDKRRGVAYVLQDILDGFMVFKAQVEPGLTDIVIYRSRGYKYFCGQENETSWQSVCCCCEDGYTTTLKRSIKPTPLCTIAMWQNFIVQKRPVDFSLNNPNPCGLCHNLLFEPTLTDPCGHMFCNSCLAQYFLQSGEISCPSCDEPVDRTRGRKPSYDYGPDLQPLESAWRVRNGFPLTIFKYV